MSLVFFGAGTSHSFKIPTMVKMVIEFENEIKTSRNEFALYEKVKDTLLKEFPPSKIDIESIFSVIDGIVNVNKPTELGYFAYYYVKSISSTNPISSQDKETAKKLKDLLEKFIGKNVFLL